MELSTKTLFPLFLFTGYYLLGFYDTSSHDGGQVVPSFTGF